MSKSHCSALKTLVAGASLACSLGLGVHCTLATAIALPTGSAGGYFAFQVTNNTGMSQSGLAAIMPGDQTSYLPNSSSGFLNSFGTSSSASYASPDTTISYSGGTINNNATATVGFSWQGQSIPDISSAGWLSATLEIDLLSMGVSPTLEALPSIAADPYEVVFANVSSANNTTPVAQWFEIPYFTTKPPTITLTNNAGVPETLSNVGYFLSDTLIPLDQLNLTNYPSSDFTPLPSSYDTSLLPLGGSESYSIPTPEPASLGVIGLGAASLLLIGRRKRA